MTALGLDRSITDAQKLHESDIQTLQTSAKNILRVEQAQFM
jgi:hypothetical protein